jgi:hypothetical protein
LRITPRRHNITTTIYMQRFMQHFVYEEIPDFFR